MGVLVNCTEQRTRQLNLKLIIAAFQSCRNMRSDEYANHIPNPKRIPKYTKVKVPNTQNKHLIS